MVRQLLYWPGEVNKCVGFFSVDIVPSLKFNLYNNAVGGELGSEVL